MKKVIVDTNIILLDANNLFKLADSGYIIVLPETVLEECDNKKSGLNEVAYQAREFGRILARGTVKETVKDTELGYVKTIIEIDDVTVEVVSLSRYSGDRQDTGYNDQKIIQVAQLVAQIDADSEVVFASNDVMARLRALTVGLTVIDFKDVECTGFEFTKHMMIEDVEVFRLLHNTKIEEVDPEHKTENYNYVFTNDELGYTKIGTISNGAISIIGKDSEKEIRLQKIRPMNTEQLLLSKAIQDPTIDIVVSEAKAGSGKAQPISELVLTPDGWSTMGNMTIGSEVIGSDGLAKKVVGVFPQGVRDVYEVTFIDGTKVRCDKEHLWSVRCRSKQNYTRFEPTTVEEMVSTWVSKEKYDKRYDSYQNVYNYSIQPASPCEYGIDTAEQTINPYALGLLLGDGCFRKEMVSFTNNSKKIIDSLRDALEPEYTLSEPRYAQGAYNVNVVRGTATETFLKVIERFGLKGHKSESKFVPKCYMNGTLATRQAVYQGLTDTDGYVKNGKVLEYSTSSEQLAEDYLELGRSIGKVFTINSRIPKYTHNGELLEGLLNYRIREMANKPKSIISIEKVGEEESQCIMVDSEDHLYVTTGYNLTHNTAVALSNAIRLVELGKYQGIVYIRNSVNDLESAEEVGYLSGNDEKFAVYLHPLHDTLDFIVRHNCIGGKLKGQELEDKIAEEIDKLVNKCNIEGMTGLGLRGRTFNDVIMIVDEAQNLSKSSLQKTLTRIGKNSKLIVIGSNRQIDHPYITKYTNGLSVLLDACRQSHDNVKLYAIQLDKVVRGRIAEFAEGIFSSQN